MFEFAVFWSADQFGDVKTPTREIDVWGKQIHFASGARAARHVKLSRFRVLYYHSSDIQSLVWTKLSPILKGSFTITVYSAKNAGHFCRFGKRPTKTCRCVSVCLPDLGNTRFCAMPAINQQNSPRIPESLWLSPLGDPLDSERLNPLRV